MPVPKRRHSRARRDRRRTHTTKLVATPMAKCDHCGEMKLSHRICMHCGYYRGRPYRTVVTS